MIHQNHEEKKNAKASSTSSFGAAAAVTRGYGGHQLPIKLFEFTYLS